MRGHRNSYVSIAGWAMLLAGALSFASCTSDETIDGIDTQGKAITFGKVSIKENSRAIDDPSYNANNPIDAFQVWGTVTGNAGNTVKIFDGATISKGDAGYGVAWTQATGTTQYWIPSAAYNFMAIAHGTVASSDSNGMPTAINYTADGETDLLLGELTTNGIKTVTTDANCEPTENPVAFTMSHLLSKVHFTFQTESAAGSFNITDIQVGGHFASGQYTIADGSWGSQTEATTTLGFGSSTGITSIASQTSDNARLIIPGTQTLSVSFTKAYFLNGTEINTEPITASLENFTFVANTEYNILVTLEGGSEITFTINSLKAWDADNNGQQQDINVKL